MRKSKNKTGVIKANGDDFQQMTVGSRRSGVVRKFMENKDEVHPKAQIKPLTHMDEFGDNRENHMPGQPSSSRRRPHSLPKRQGPVPQRQGGKACPQSELGKEETELTEEEDESEDEEGNDFVMTEGDKLKAMLFIEGTERFLPSRSRIITRLEQSYDASMKMLMAAPSLFRRSKCRVRSKEDKNSWDSLWANSMKCLLYCEGYAAEEEMKSRKLDEKKSYGKGDYFQEYYDSSVSALVQSTNEMINSNLGKDEKKSKRAQALSPRRKRAKHALSPMRSTTKPIVFNTSNFSMNYKSKKSINFGTSTVKFYDPDTQPSTIRVTETIPIPHLENEESSLNDGKACKNSNKISGKMSVSRKALNTVDGASLSSNIANTKHSQKNAKKRDRPSICDMTTIERRKYFGIKSMNSLEKQQKEDLVKMMQACHRENLMMPGYQPSKNVNKASIVYWMSQNVFEF